MVLKSPAASSTAGCTVAPVANLPAPNRVTVSTALRTRNAGTAADADLVPNSIAVRPAGRPRPRLVSRPRSKPRARDSAHFHRSNRPAQTVRYLPVGPPLKVAEHDRFPILLRQPRELFMQRRREIELMPFLLVLGPRRAAAPAAPRRLLGRARLVFLPPGRCHACPSRDPPGHAEQPARDRLSLANRARSSRQDQKRGLEGILRLMSIGEHPPAHLQDHGTVPLHQRLESRFVPTGDKALQQVAVRQGADRPAGEQSLQVLQSSARAWEAHWSSTREFSCVCH